MAFVYVFYSIAKLQIVRAVIFLIFKLVYNNNNFVQLFH